MMALVNHNDPHGVAFTEFHAALFYLLTREFEQAEVLATHALELSEKNDYPNQAAFCRCILGHAQGQLGRTSEAIRNLRSGIADLMQVGSYLGIGKYSQYLAEALEGEGLVGEALETIEQDLSQDFDRPIARPERLRMLAEPRLNQGQAELAEKRFARLDCARTRHGR
jgi:tetratricopeptide (TPR) repeat protein